MTNQFRVSWKGNADPCLDHFFVKVISKIKKYILSNITRNFIQVAHQLNKRNTNHVHII
jgi:hypothetical protein